MSRLVGDVNKHAHAHHICYRCLHRFQKEETLKEHLQYCTEHSIQHVKMPEEGENILSFTNIQFQHRVPFIIYADFESLIVPMDSAQQCENISFTNKIAQHQPCGYAYVLIGPNSTVMKPVTVYRGDNAAEHFVQSLIQVKKELVGQLTHVAPMIFTKKDEHNFLSATQCYICKNALGKDRVRDHCHITGQYRGALHSVCNLQYKLKKCIPVIFHNLKNYDAHHILQGLKTVKDHEVKVIATSMEKYISFSLANRED
ncbi:hypothetical protein X975_13384, partial [Stegodyphus mimosarum]